MNQSTWTADFLLESRGPRAWCLRDGATLEILLTGVDLDPRATPTPVRRAQVRWREDGGADVELADDAGTYTLRARHVSVHRPLPLLYAALPLASYDETSRRFWQRIFWLVRVPGGRTLLNYIARRARAKA